MSTPGRPKSSYRSAQHEGTPVSADGVAELRFRDYLRAHAAEAKRYTALNRELAALHANDRDAYTDGKAAFVQRACSKAEAGPRP